MSGAHVGQPTIWRSTGVVREGKIGVSFESEEGEILRLVLPVDCARIVAETLFEALGKPQHLSHSPRSSGMPRLDGSPNEGQSQ